MQDDRTSDESDDPALEAPDLGGLAADDGSGAGAPDAGVPPVPGPPPGVPDGDGEPPINLGVMDPG